MQNLKIKQAEKVWIPLTNFIYVPHNNGSDSFDFSKT